MNPLALALIFALSLLGLKGIYRLLRRLHVQELELATSKRALDEILQEDWMFLSETNRALSSTLDFDHTLKNIVELGVPDLADSCILDLLRKDGSYDRAHSGDQSLPFPESISCRVVKSGQALLLSDIYENVYTMDGLNLDELEHVRAAEIKSLMTIPLFSRGEPIGAITFASRKSGRRYNDKSLSLAKQIAFRAALAIENSRLYQQAQEAVRAREDLIAIISHELKTPLTAIDMQIELVQKLVSPESQKAMIALKRAQDSTRQMKDLVCHLLDYSKFESGQFRMERTWENVNDFIQKATDSLEAIAEKNSIVLVIHPSPQECMFWVDRHWTYQALSNLVGNALKFTPSHGMITIEATFDNSEVTISVTDTGRGIAPEHLSRVFDRYWQAERTPTTGTGLGLAITRSIIEAQSGRVHVESRLGHGAKFSFTLPGQVRSSSLLA